MVIFSFSCFPAKLPKALADFKQCIRWQCSHSFQWYLLHSLYWTGPNTHLHFGFYTTPALSLKLIFSWIPFKPSVQLREKKFYKNVSNCGYPMTDIKACAMSFWILRPCLRRKYSRPYLWVLKIHKNPHGCHWLIQSHPCSPKNKSMFVVKKHV